MTTFERFVPRVRAPIYSARAASFVGWTWFAFVLGLALLMTGLLLGPRVAPADQHSNCIGNVKLAEPFGFSLNCDSPQFMWLARAPDGLLEKDNARQSRPGFIMAAALLQDLIAQVVPPGAPPTRIGTGFLEPKLITQSFSRDLPAYLAYIVLNIGLLLASFHYWRKLVEPSFGANAAIGMIVVATGLLLVANDVTKAFVWSPHTQMFNLLVPLIALYATLRAWQGAILDRRFVLAIGAIVGIGMTAYPVFVIIPACLAPIAIWSAERRRALGNLALLLALSAAPSALWYVYVLAHTGSYYQYEVAQGEVVWMAEAWAKGFGNFLAEWFEKLGSFLVMAAPQAVPLLALLLWVAVVAASDARARAQFPSLLPMALAALYVSAAVLGFYTCVGWDVGRLAYPMIPPLLAAVAAGAVLLATRMDLRHRTVFVAGCALITVAQVVYLVAKDGPWS